MNVLTIDIGGTAIKRAIYNHEGHLVKDLPVVTTAVSETDNRILQQVLDIINEEKGCIAGVAIASAGVVDPETGKIIYAGPTIPNYTGTEIAATVKKTYKLKCCVENDVNAAALGEYWLGAAKGSHSTLCITIGTGVGGAVLIGGKIWRGYSFTAGEVGYLPVDNGLNLQEIASTTALLANYAELSGEKVCGEVFFKRLNQNDASATRAFQYFIKNLARGLLSGIYLFAPETLVIGGGISAQGEWIEKDFRTELSAQIQSERFLPKNIVSAKLGNRAGMLGALRHFLDQYQS